MRDRKIVIASELSDMVPFIQYRKLDLILLDTRLAKIEGGQSKVISKIRESERSAQAPIVLIAAHCDVAGRRVMLGYGADDVVFVEPTIDSEGLHTVVRRLLNPVGTWEQHLPPEEQAILRQLENELPPEEVRSLKTSVAAFTGMLDDARANGQISYRAITGNLGDMRKTALNPAAMKAMFKLGGHDVDTLRHSLRVMGFLHSFQKAWGLSDIELVAMEGYAVGHDSGKTGISKDTINFPGRYNEAQRLEMQAHTKYGDILLRGHGPDGAANVALYHHQRFDGGPKGYPDPELRGKDIPEEARMIAVVDVLDALLSKRSYKAEMSMREAVAEMQSDVGHFDPDLTRSFLGS